MPDKNRILAFFRDQSDIKLVGKAYDLAKKIHASHKRDNGDPYFIHPFRVALILLDEFKILDANLIAAALLHDVLEMSDVAAKELAKEFNKEVAHHVELLTKPKQRTEKGWEDKYYRKIMRSDHGTQLVKFADRLDNIRDLKNCTKEKQIRYLKATEERFLPWAKDVDKGFYSKLLDEIRKLKIDTPAF